MEEKKHRKYRVDDRELLIKLYRRLFWNRIVPRIPARISPNTITVLGQAFAVMAVLATYSAVHGAPWMFPVASLFLFCYVSCDNLDGPHARNTGQSSPLGEFLDHGLDGIASAATLICTAYTFHAGGMWMFFLCALGAVGFLLPFWEQCHTGELVIPELGPTEGITLLILVQMSVWIFGTPDWLVFRSGHHNVAFGIIVFVLVGYALAIVPPMFRVLKVREPVWDLFPLVAYILSSVGFVAAGAEPIWPALLVSAFGADIVCRLIFRRIESQRRVLGAIDLLAIAPIIPALAFPQIWHAHGWAMLGATIALGRYGVTVATGCRRLQGPSQRPATVLQ